MIKPMNPLMGAIEAVANLKATVENRSPADMVNELTYNNYSYNRERSPDITVEQWGRVFGESVARKMEARFQKEKTK